MVRAIIALGWPGLIGKCCFVFLRSLTSQSQWHNGKHPVSFVSLRPSIFPDVKPRGTNGQGETKLI